MWEKKVKKTIYTLAIDNWRPEITSITFPLFKHFAKKIGADFHVITKRRFLDWPVTFEKYQVYYLAQEHENDWNLFIDADALVHPEMPDFFQWYTKDTCGHNGSDPLGIRYRYDRFFFRDGRGISSCNWFTFASDWCIDIWHPCDDLTPEEAIARCTPTVEEEQTVCHAEHLIDDFLCSRNIAKYGLKFRTLMQTFKDNGWENPGFLWHQYTLTPEEKYKRMQEVLRAWRLV